MKMFLSLASLSMPQVDVSGKNNAGLKSGSFSFLFAYFYGYYIFWGLQYAK